LTTNHIAVRAEVNIATLYQYFPGKEAILAELMRRHVVETRAAAPSVLRSGAAAGSEEIQHLRGCGRYWDVGGMTTTLMGAMLWPAGYA
jgi:AcrR family transcriptional regulator